MENLIKGIASFDGETASNMVAFCDPKNTWNGWAMPFIHEDFIPDLITRLTYEENSFTMEGENIRTIEKDGDEIICDDLIHPTIIEGEKYYYFGWLGLCFDFEPLKEDARRQAIIVDIEGLIYDDEEGDEVEPLQLGEIVYVNDWGYNNWQVYVQSQYNGGGIHGIDTERIKLI